MSEIVRLNVGGVIYTTTRATLCTYPDSMLGAMFSGNYGLTKDENGCFFIDRDGAMFKHILAFLRSNSLILPQNFTEFDLLKSEAEFYQINPLLDALSGYEKKEPKYLEIIEKVMCYSDDPDSDDGYHYVVCVIGRKDSLLEIPADFGLNVEENSIQESSYETPRAFACIKLAGKSTTCMSKPNPDISFRPSLASYLFQRGWKLLHSTSSREGCDSQIPKHIVHERWIHEN